MNPITGAEARTVREAIAEIREHGYTVIPDFMTPEQLYSCTSALQAIEAETAFGQENFGGTRTKRASNLLGRTRAFDDTVTDERLLQIVEGVLGPAFQLSIIVMIKIFPGETAQPLHQDDGLWPATRPHQSFVCNTMFAIDDFTADNGGTNIVPFSHTSLEPVDQNAERIMVSMPRGSLLIWDGACWHGGGASTGDTERCGFNVNYNVGWLRQQENQFVSIPQETIPMLSERLQRLLGYQYHGILGRSNGEDPLEVIKRRVG